MKHFINLCCVALLAGITGCDSGADNGLRDLARGRAAWVTQDYAAAARAFESCAQKNPTNFEARISLALVGLAQGEPRRADRAIQDAIQLDPTSAEARLVEGSTAYLGRDYSRAKNAFTAVATTRDLPATLRSQALASRAVVELAMDETDQARLSLMRALRFNFKNAAAWYHLGVLSRNMYNFKAAARDQFEMACRLDPDSQRTRNVQKNILPALREAIRQDSVDKPGAARRNPEYAAQLLAEAVRAEKKGDMRKAHIKYEQAYAVDPLSYEAAFAYAQNMAKQTKVTAAHIDRTLVIYKAALDAKPAKRDTCIAAARYALQNRRASIACNFLSHALAHFPDSKSVLDLYVEALAKLGTKEGARRAELYRAYRREI